MTLKEQKVAIENSVKEIIQTNIQEQVEVSSFYSIENGIMNVSLIERKEEGANDVVLHYEINFNEESKEIAMTAFQRFIQKDQFGPAVVINTPITIDSMFMTNIGKLIEYGIDKVLHPEHYEVAKESDSDASKDE